MALVCDGIGGVEQGEIASGYIAEQIVEWFYKEAIPLIGKRKSLNIIKRSALRSIYDLYCNFNQYGKVNEISLGSTMTLLLLFQKQYLIFHLGNSRAYFYGKRMLQLTRDHCRGVYGLTKCMGSSFWESPSILCGKVSKNNAFLLCTDGFCHVVSQKRMEQALQPKEVDTEEQIELRLQEIAEYSMKRGEQDNISAVYIKVK